jgi:mono/diheme cytochrome c family protein
MCASLPTSRSHARARDPLPIRQLGFAIVAGALLVGAPAIAADAAKGKEAYMRFGCWACHGTVGQGASTGPKLAPDPMPLDAFSNVIRHSPQAMPPYSDKVLPEADIADMHAYLASLPKPANVKDIPLLSP